MKLLYFAWVRQKLGTGEEAIDVPANIGTVGEVLAHLRERGGAYADVFSNLKRLRAAVNREHVGWDAPVQASDEVAFFPPVTGG